MKVNEIITEAVKQRLDPKCWKGHHKEGTKIKGGVRVNNCVPNESVEEAANPAQQAAIAIAMKKAGKKPKANEAEGDCEGLPHLTKTLLTHIVQQIGTEGAHALVKSLTWGDGAAKELLHKIVDDLKDDLEQDEFPEETYEGDEFYEAYGDLWFDENGLYEAEYRGRKVPLGKPMQGDVKKFKVYVKDPKTGNVKKVNFGDPNMRIKKSNPARRKSFRARHNCANPGPRTKARYWSCRKW